jgi:hypothetical protein
LYGLEEFFEIGTHWEVGILRGLVGSFDGDLSLVVVVDGVGPGGLLRWLCMMGELRN